MENNWRSDLYLQRLHLPSHYWRTSVNTRKGCGSPGFLPTSAESQCGMHVLGDATVLASHDRRRVLLGRERCVLRNHQTYWKFNKHFRRSMILPCTEEVVPSRDSPEATPISSQQEQQLFSYLFDVCADSNAFFADCCAHETGPGACSIPADYSTECTADSGTNRRVFGPIKHSIETSTHSRISPGNYINLPPTTDGFNTYLTVAGTVRELFTTLWSPCSKRPSVPNRHSNHPIAVFAPLFHRGRITDGVSPYSVGRWCTGNTCRRPVITCTFVLLLGGREDEE